MQTINGVSHDEWERRQQEAVRLYEQGQPMCVAAAALSPDRVVRGALSEAELQQMMERLIEQHGGQQ
jgi:hypothetical protein